MDAGLEGIVERLDAVSGQEEDTLEVLQQAQKDADEGVAMDVLDRAFLQKYISFVEEQNGAPGMCNIKNLIELGFEFAWIGAKLASTDHVQGAFQKFGDTFCRQGLASSRRSMENSDKPATLA